MEILKKRLKFRIGEAHRGENMPVDPRRRDPQILGCHPHPTAEAISALVNDEGPRDVDHLEVAPQAQLEELDLSDKGGRSRLEDMTYFLVASFEFLGTLYVFEDGFVVRNLGKCGQEGVSFLDCVLPDAFDFGTSGF